MICQPGNAGDSRRLAFTEPKNDRDKEKGFLHFESMMALGFKTQQCA